MEYAEMRNRTRNAAVMLEDALSQKASDECVVQRRDVIVHSARQLFVREGHSAFSMRAVAKQQGISLGHLQHFFPTKSDLLSAMLEYTAASYLKAYDDFLATLSDTPDHRFRQVVKYLLDDVSNEEVAIFFLELWPVTVRDTSSRGLLRRLYQRNRYDFAQFIAAIRPELPSSRVDSLALQVLAMIDGVLIYNHTESPSPQELAAVTADVLDTVDHLVKSA
jgi:AcrR family transcriptional regulator